MKRSVEREALGYGVEIKHYHSDNGIFKSADFEQALEDDVQFISKSGVGAHHQNGVAERAIGTVHAMARSMLLHLRIHWPDEFDPSLWPYALDYAVYIYNHLPFDVRDGLSPEDVFSGVVSGCGPLRRLRVFGCPTYVLDPRLQDGKKIPKWQPRARVGMFLGFSQEHSSTVALILNTDSGHISPQFHVVFDERFQTVTSDMVVDLEETWLDLFLESRDVFLDWFDSEVDSMPTLSEDWLIEEEDLGRVDVPVPIEQRPFNLGRAPPRRRRLRTSDQLRHDRHQMLVRDREESPIARRTRSRTRRAVKANPTDVFYRPVFSRTLSHVAHITDPSCLAYATLDWEVVHDDPTFLHFHNMFTRFYDSETCELLDGDAIHPFALASKLHNEDFPSFKEILRLPDDEKEKWMSSMDEELQALHDSGTFEFVDRSEVLKQGEEIVKTTWAFRKKRTPSGEVYRYKSRMCVRGDLQRGTYDSNETFAPVVEWATIRMVFTLALLEDWTTASIDFKNAFAQAMLPKPIYLELPPGYAQANPGHKNFVMKINKSLYGDRRAANLWYRKLRATLELANLDSLSPPWILVFSFVRIALSFSMLMMLLSLPSLRKRFKVSSRIFVMMDMTFLVMELFRLISASNWITAMMAPSSCRSQV